MSKVKLYLYTKKFAAIFNRERELISSALAKCEIHHIGSTAVPGLGGKGIVDIMIALDSWKEEKDVIERLRKAGFSHIHPKEKGQIFLSRISGTRYRDTHLHIVRKGSRPYKEYLAFRDYLRKHRAEAERYMNLKRLWLKQSEGARRRYTASKDDYVRDVLRRCRQEGYL